MDRWIIGAMDWAIDALLGNHKIQMSKIASATAVKL